MSNRTHIARRLASSILPGMVLMLGLTARAADPPRYSPEIAGLLKDRCVKCHGPTKSEGGLNLSTAAGLAKGGKNGPVVRPHDLENSPIWERIDADEMPPKSPLNSAERERLKSWIVAGASGLSSPGNVDDDHWAFRKLTRPSLPIVRESARILEPIDRFIESTLEASGSTLAPEAPRRSLVRRVALILTGLPPTASEVADFLTDASPEAYERMVEHYLASPHYGERWGKHWLDAAGYAESNGYFQADTPRPLAYRYRDYVIRSFNEDRPFDRFLREQLAGDELTDLASGKALTTEDVDRLVATHFLRNGQDGTGESDGNPDELRVDRYTALESCMQIVASSLLGLTLHCAKCHAHKFEPITHEDYYRFQAIFDPVFPAATEKLWIKPQARFILAPLKGEKEDWDRKVADASSNLAMLRKDRDDWVRSNRPKGEVVFRDDFESAAPLASRWSNTAPTDNGPGGSPAVTLDVEKAPAARIRNGRLEVIAGGTHDSWITTKTSFDWTPENVGESIQITFDLVDTKLSPTATSAERIGYFIAAHDFNDDGKVAGGNILIDGNPSGSSSVHLDYPGKDSTAKGSLGKTGYHTGGNYGLRITKTTKGEFRVDHLVQGAVDPGSITLSASDLPNGGFGFEYHALRSFVIDNLLIERFPAPPAEIGTRLAAFESGLEGKQKAFDAADTLLTGLKQNPPGKVSSAGDVTPTPPETHLLLRGDYGKPGASMVPAPLSALSRSPRFDLKPKPAAKTTGRRLALADWLTNPNERASSLLSRVQVNRIWQGYFGQGIVSTPENLGLSGAPPSHPELLDYLASEFIRTGWSVKQIHRRILHSATFRQASAVKGDDALLGRFPVHRLDAESIRDAALAVSGDLDPSMGGPSVPFQARDDGAVVIPESQAGGRRRSVYLQTRRTQVISLLQVFDAPSIVYNSLRRPRTAMPLQSLALMNSEFIRARAGSFARRVAKEQPEESRRIARAHGIAFGRPPTLAEAAAAADFLKVQAKEYGDGPEGVRKAWIDYCHALLISNEFLYIH